MVLKNGKKRESDLATGKSMMQSVGFSLAENLTQLLLKICSNCDDEKFNLLLYVYESRGKHSRRLQLFARPLKRCHQIISGDM